MWSALTTPERLARWWGRVEGDLKVGGTFDLEVQWQGTGRVIACEPPHRLVVIIRESDESYRKGVGAPPFDSRIEATLTPDGDHTRLVIEVRGMELGRIAYYGTGWQIHAENLARYLAGAQRDDSEQRWDELVPLYLPLAAKVNE